MVQNEEKNISIAQHFKKIIKRKYFGVIYEHVYEGFTELLFWLFFPGHDLVVVENGGLCGFLIQKRLQKSQF